MLHDSIINASPIKEKKSPSVLRYDSVHMLRFSNDVLKNVLLNAFTAVLCGVIVFNCPIREFSNDFLSFFENLL
jgi:hypothetical protein